MHLTIGNFGSGTIIHDEYRKLMEAVNKALTLDKNLADAHSASCENKMSYEYDFDGAERECKRSGEVDPNSSLAHLTYSRYLTGKPPRIFVITGVKNQTLSAADRDIVTGVIYKPLDALEVDRLIQQSLRAAV